MPRTSRKEQIQDGDQEQQNEEEGSQTRGNTRAKRTTGLSYHRPRRDYSKSTKWTYQMNKDLAKLYKTSQPGKLGYMKRLKDLCTLTKFTAKHLAEQVRNIKRRKLLPEPEFNWLPEQTPEDNNLTGRVQHITEEPEPTITSPEDNNLSRRGQQLNETSETGDNYEEEVTRNHYPEKESNENVPQAQLLNTEQQLEKEKLRKLWNKNFEKYIDLEINYREYSTKARPPPKKEKLTMIDLIVKEELNRIEENYGMNIWTLNVIYYTTAVTLLENEGNLREERWTQKPYKKPGWKIRHESSIQAIRKKISHAFVLIECNRKQKFSNNQKIIRRKIEKQYGKATTPNLKYMQAMLKQELKVESQKLKRREVVEERRPINRKFKIAPKSVFRTMKGEGSEPVRDVPDPEKLEKFWGGLWGTEADFNKEAPWLKTLEREYVTNATQLEYEITDEILDKVIAKMSNDKPGIDLTTCLWIKALQCTKQHLK